MLLMKGLCHRTLLILRGIDVVREKIKMFAQRKVSLPPGRHKIIILDEADSMTTGAQQALRRTMELYSSTTRFALACNISSKIIEAIQSRCAILRFSRLRDEELLKRMLQVLEMENISDHTTKGLDALLFTAEGDMRSALNNLQATIAGFQFVTAENVYKVCDQPDPVALKVLLNECANGNVKKAIVVLKGLFQRGHAPSDLIATVFRVCKTLEMPHELRLKYIKCIGEYHLRISQGVDSFVQLSGLVGDLCSLKA